MSSYIHFTEEEKEQARNTDLAALLKRRGETLWCGIADDKTNRRPFLQTYLKCCHTFAKSKKYNAIIV